MGWPSFRLCQPRPTGHGRLFFGPKNEDVLANPLPTEERADTDFLPFEEGDDTGLPESGTDEPMPPELEESLAEMEKFVHEKPVPTMYYHFDLDPAQFPPADQLTDNDLDQLVLKICRLWASYNFTAVLPKKVPARVVYPILLKKMFKPTFVMNRGNIGVEFCYYEPKECPFGEEWCSCKEF